MEYFLQQLINGVTLGSIYGLIAIGYTMVYGIIGMINFAHGDIFYDQLLRLADRLLAAGLYGPHLFTSGAVHRTSGLDADHVCLWLDR